MKSIEVVAAIIFDGKGHIFATQRGYGDMKDGWEFPGGKIEPGETPESALQREIWEELETDIEVGQRLQVVEWDYPKFHLMMHCFWCSVKHGRLTLKEHEAARWLTIDELDSVDWLPADRQIIDTVKAYWRALCTMKWTVLVDNRTNHPELETEHGLSILLETDRHRILLDTGASDMFIRNAERLDIDLSSVDYVFVSHGHSDHAGGLHHFMEMNKTAKVIVSPEAIGRRFFSKRGDLHSITAQWPEIPEGRLLLMDNSREVCEGLYVMAHIPQVHAMPKGNRVLYVQRSNGDLVLDDFCHELALYADGLLFTGCAHSGLENILAACPWPVHTVVGGFHLLDGQETEDELTALAERLKAHYPQTQFYTSHCTGDRVLEVLRRVMGNQVQGFCC